MPAVTDFAGTVPHNYETYLGPLFFEPYAIDLVERIEKADYKSVIELACGTGRVTKHLLKKIATDGRLFATDLNADMLSIAQGKVADSRIEWKVADAHALPYGDNSFDLAVCQYGVMFFADKPKALHEVWRVLKPGSKFYFNTWDSMERNAVSQLTNDVLKEIFSEDPPTFFERGPYSMYDTNHIQQLLTDAGFTQIRMETVSKTSVTLSPDDVLKGILDGTPVSAFLKDKPEKAALVRERLRERLSQQYGEKDLALPMQAIIITAMKS